MLAVDKLRAARLHRAVLVHALHILRDVLQRVVQARDALNASVVSARGTLLDTAARQLLMLALAC